MVFRWATYKVLCRGAEISGPLSELKGCSLRSTTGLGEIKSLFAKLLPLPLGRASGTIAGGDDGRD